MVPSGIVADDYVERQKRHTDWHTDNIAQGHADMVAVFWWSRYLIAVDCEEHGHMGSHCTECTDCDAEHSAAGIALYSVVGREDS